MADVGYLRPDLTALGVPAPLEKSLSGLVGHDDPHWSAHREAVAHQGAHRCEDDLAVGGVIEKLAEDPGVLARLHDDDPGEHLVFVDHVRRHGGKHEAGAHRAPPSGSFGARSPSPCPR